MEQLGLLWSSYVFITIMTVDEQKHQAATVLYYDC